MHPPMRTRSGSVLPAEINAWTGGWTFKGSTFDCGTGKHCIPKSSRLNGLVQIPETYLNLGGDFFYQGFVIVAKDKELPAERADNLGSKRFTATWNSSAWVVDNPSTNNPYRLGSILEQWKELHKDEPEAYAKVCLVSNGDKANNYGSDENGVYYLGARAWQDSFTGLWHYSYSVHNRDNYTPEADVNSGAVKLRIQTCPKARWDLGLATETPKSFDIDAYPDNDWVGKTITVGQNTFLEFTAPLTGPANAISWNTIRAFSFGSDAAPVKGNVEIHTEEGKIVSLQNWVPGRLTNTPWNGGCGSSGFQLFSGDEATLGEPNFRLTSTGHTVGQWVSFHVSTLQGFTLCGPCRSFTDAGTEILLVNVLVKNAPFAVLECVIPNDPALEGVTWYAQTLTVTFGTGGCGSNPTLEFTDGMKIYLGNNVINCPQ